MADLPQTGSGLRRREKQEKDIIRTEAQESFQAALSAAKGDPKAEAWVKANSHLWRK